MKLDVFTYQSRVHPWEEWVACAVVPFLNDSRLRVSGDTREAAIERLKNVVEGQFTTYLKPQHTTVEVQVPTEALSVLAYNARLGPFLDLPPGGGRAVVEVKVPKAPEHHHPECGIWDTGGCTKPGVCKMEYHHSGCGARLGGACTMLNLCGHMATDEAQREEIP